MGVVRSVCCVVAGVRLVPAIGNTYETPLSFLIAIRQNGVYSQINFIGVHNVIMFAIQRGKIAYPLGTINQGVALDDIFYICLKELKVTFIFNSR